ncbi:hypothetical protein K1719_029741 [Acacia pycnantha]|nr:hypothetical protein K1719_029741 [Acacia pycnantha]
MEVKQMVKKVGCGFLSKRMTMKAAASCTIKPEALFSFLQFRSPGTMVVDVKMRAVVKVAIMMVNAYGGWDSGSTVGDFDGHSRRVLSCAFKPTRPFRIVTCGENFLVNFYDGPPFKFNKSIKFSSDGTKFITVSSDRKGIIYDGKSGDKLGELSAESGHKGSIYVVSWSPDSKQVLTVSADKSTKIWDIVEDGIRSLNKTLSSSESGGVEDMLVGNGCCGKLDSKQFRLIKLLAAGEEEVITVGFDNKVWRVPLQKANFRAPEQIESGIVLLNGSEIVATHNLDFTVTASATSLDGSEAIVGGQDASSRRTIKGAHLGGVYGLAFIDNDSVVSFEEHGCIRVWELASE